MKEQNILYYVKIVVLKDIHKGVDIIPQYSVKFVVFLPYRHKLDHFLSPSITANVYCNCRVL